MFVVVVDFDVCAIVVGDGVCAAADDIFLFVSSRNRAIKQQTNLGLSAV